MRRRLSKKINKKPIAEPNKELAELNSLINESNELTNYINFPLNNLILFLTLSLCEQLFIDDKKLLEFIASIPEVLSEILEIESTTTQYSLLIFIPIILYLYSKAHQFIASKTKSLFPNGVGFSKEEYKQLTRQQKLLNQKEIDHNIYKLKTLIDHQKKFNRYIHWGSYFSALILPKLLNFNPNIEIEINFSIFGFFISLGGIQSNNLSNNFMKVAKNIAENFQAFTISSSIYDFYNNYNTPKQLQSHQNKLHQLTLKKAKIDFSGNRKSSALFNINLSGKTKIQLGKALEIDSEIYLRELHRLCIEEKIPVFATDYASLYIGYSALSNSKAAYLAKTLSNRLKTLAQDDKKASLCVNILNKKTNQLIEFAKWDSYVTYNKPQKIHQTWIYLNTKSIKDHSNFPTFISCLKNSGINFKESDNVFSINIKKLDQDLLKNLNFYSDKSTENSHSSISQSTKSSNLQKSFNKKSPIISNNQLTFRKNKIKNINKPKEDQKEIPLKESFPPEVIKFKCGATFFKNPTREQAQSKNRAYPLNLPWLSDGCAYGVIPENVFPFVEDYLKRDKVLSRLERGKIIGLKSQKNTKVGKVGIQPCTNAYQSVDGKDHDNSDLKLKYANNIRIFGRRLETQSVHDKNINLYVFDGPGWGH